MDSNFEPIIKAVENLSIDELRSFLDAEIDQARAESLRARSEKSIALYLNGIPEHLFFDRLVFFKNITKDLDLSVSDCKSILNINLENITNINREIAETDSFAESLFSSFKKSIEKTLSTLDSDTYFDDLSEQPLKKLYLAMENKKEVSYQYVEDVLNSIDYSPRHLSHSVNTVYVRDGDFENYLNHRKEAHDIYREISSKVRFALREKVDKLVAKRDELYRNPQEIRKKMIHWRTAAIECLGASYSDAELTTNALMITYE